MGPGQGQAHHIIPWELRNNAVVQRAARGGFNINGVDNGIRLLSPQHLGSHRRYTAAVQRKLDRLLATNPGLSDVQTADLLRGYAGQLSRGLTRSSARLR
jgi:hypothetical protein